MQDSLVSNSGLAKGMPAGPRPSQMLAVPCHLVCKRLRYSNRTVKYCIKAVSNYVKYVYIVTPAL